jgi:hypothetical protein
MSPKKKQTAKKTVNEHQRDVNISGNKFQNDIFEIISEGLKDNKRVMVAQPSSKIKTTPPVETEEKNTPRRYVCLEIHTPAGSIIGDTDIVIFNKKHARPICIVSCKTSLHSRNTESLYYARLYRDKWGKDLPFYFVTSDNSIEFGSADAPTKPRVLFHYENISVYSTNSKTQTGGYIKPVSQLIPDLKRIC